MYFDHAVSAVLWLMKDRSGGAVCHRPTVVIELDIPYLIEDAVNARRPRSGRSAATSIDGAEHGDMLPTRDGRAQQRSAPDVPPNHPIEHCRNSERLR
jgi:hypothetical protein